MIKTIKIFFLQFEIFRFQASKIELIRSNYQGRLISKKFQVTPLIFAEKYKVEIGLDSNYREEISSDILYSYRKFQGRIASNFSSIFREILPQPLSQSIIGKYFTSFKFLCETHGRILKSQPLLSCPISGKDFQVIALTLAANFREELF